MSVNQLDSTQATQIPRERGRPITSENARELQKLGAQAKRRRRRERDEKP